MRQIGASRFKARCLALLDEVAETGERIVITKRGRPVAVVQPYVGTDAFPQRTMRDTVEVYGDMTEPTTSDDEILIERDVL
ncbi:MAG: type II toxin-antitoxin system Phd/YefM family antitoxin [Candidatus Dadabacteria bacterium]|nr:MAG: type II toxin-antitoxin system Phd/YefM family antitoxin [Candidatus Dadabacteria bacterium]